MISPGLLLIFYMTKKNMCGYRNTSDVDRVITL